MFTSNTFSLYISFVFSYTWNHTINNVLFSHRLCYIFDFILLVLYLFFPQSIINAFHQQYYHKEFTLCRARSSLKCPVMDCKELPKEQWKVACELRRRRVDESVSVDIKLSVADRTNVAPSAWLGETFRLNAQHFAHTFQIAHMPRCYQ